MFLLGAEREGLPAEVERDVDAWIPIGGAESLNVAVAGAIALYEWRRQNQSAMATVAGINVTPVKGSASSIRTRSS